MFMSWIFYNKQLLTTCKNISTTINNIIVCLLFTIYV